MRKIAHFSRLVMMLAVAGLGACGGEEKQAYGPQTWQNLQVVVETRPTPVAPGMNEFIVIASRNNNRPGVGMVVSLRIDEQAEWRQAIQDGYTGVYRRAIRVNDPATDVLAVHLRNTEPAAGETTETILYFPLKRN